MSRLFFYILFTHSAMFAHQAYTQPTIQYAPQMGHVIVHSLQNFPPVSQQIQWKHYFPIYVGNPTTIKPDQSEVLGVYHVKEDKLIFAARYPLVKGQTYTAKFNLQKYNADHQSNATQPTQTVTYTFTVAKPLITTTTHVSGVYPTSDILPENLLKFYIYFSTPMQRGQTYPHISLLDSYGNRVSQPFLEVTPELWSPTTQRFTLFFDPGRIKRGLMPNKDLGLALQASNTYRLVIDQSLRDANGNPISASYTKTFTATSADRTSPNPRAWVITTHPTKKTHEPLVLKLNEPLDYALLQSMLEIQNPNGKILTGAIEITHQETQWHFIPKNPWAPGLHTIHINDLLEDLAGNQLTRLFDIDIEKHPAPSPGTIPLVLPFQIP